MQGGGGVSGPEAAPGHLGLVSAVDAGDVVPLDVPEAVEGGVAGKGDREVVPQRQDLAALVCEVVDQLAVLAVFA